MSIISTVSKIGSETKKFVTKDISCKVLGGVTLASVVYDMYEHGKEKAVAKDIVETAERYDENYRNYMNMRKPSQTIADMKNGWFEMQHSFSWTHIVSKVSGFLKGISQVVMANLPEIVLSVLALKVKNHQFLGKLSGGLLSINALKVVLFDVMGIGSGKN